MNKVLNQYDIQYLIINHLDINSILKFTSTCKSLNQYTQSNHYNYIIIKKIINYFSNLQKINLGKDIKFDNETRLILFNIFVKYKNHPKTPLSDFLHELSNNAFLFEKIIQNCYFCKNSLFIDYNTLRVNDIMHLLTFNSKDILYIITRYIFLVPEVLFNIIQLKLKQNKKLDVKILLDYMLFKHFYKYNDYINDILTQIVCDCIKYDRLDCLQYIYSKQKHFRFIINYQDIFNITTLDTHVKYLHLINTKLEGNPVIILPNQIYNIMINKQFKILDCIIDLYLGETINMNRYFDIIYSHFDITNDDCKVLTRFFNTENQKKLECK